MRKSLRRQLRRGQDQHDKNRSKSRVQDVSSGKGRKLEMRHSARKPGVGQERGAGGEEAEVHRDPTSQADGTGL